MKRQYERCFQIYKWIIAFERNTGNGGGDPDTTSAIRTDGDGSDDNESENGDDDSDGDDDMELEESEGLELPAASAEGNEVDEDEAMDPDLALDPAKKKALILKARTHDLAGRIDRARSAGRDVGKLSVKTATWWYQTGVYDLFDAR